MDVAGISRPALVAMIVVALGLFATGGAWAASWLTHHTDTTTQILPAASALAVDGRVGDIRIEGTDRSDVRLVTKERRSVFGRPHVKIRYENGRLRLDSHCSGVNPFGDNCTVSYQLEVPRDIAVHLETAAGDLHAKDLHGPADLSTSAGDVHVTDVDGQTLRVHSTSGDVDADSAAPDIDASTTSGDVHVRARAARNVRAQTTAGDVHLSVPDTPYAVQTHVTDGDEHVDVDTDRSAPRHLTAITTAGDLHISPDG
jgi:DUF4097 and DUF4098 domain-containing protein YvlB